MILSLFILLGKTSPISHLEIIAFKHLKNTPVQNLHCDIQYYETSAAYFMYKELVIQDIINMAPGNEHRARMFDEEQENFSHNLYKMQCYVISNVQITSNYNLIAQYEGFLFMFEKYFINIDLLLDTNNTITDLIAKLNNLATFVELENSYISMIRIFRKNGFINTISEFSIFLNYIKNQFFKNAIDLNYEPESRDILAKSYIRSAIFLIKYIRSSFGMSKEQLLKQE